MEVLLVSKIPTIPKKYANQQVIYRMPSGVKDKYGKQTQVDTIINNCVVQQETIYSGTNNGRQVVANAVIFLYADVTNPMPKLDKTSQGNKIIFEGVEYTIQRIVDNRNPSNNEVWSYEVELRSGGIVMAIKLDFDRANHIMASSNKKSSQFKAANQAMMAMERFVPKSDIQKQNRLRTASNVSNDGEHIIYTMPYARAQFFGVINGSQIRNYTTPGTSSRWDKRLIGDKSLMKTVTDVYVKELMK